MTTAAITPITSWSPVSVRSSSIAGCSGRLMSPAPRPPSVTASTSSSTVAPIATTPKSCGVRSRARTTFATNPTTRPAYVHERTISGPAKVRRFSSSGVTLASKVPLGARSPSASPGVSRSEVSGPELIGVVVRPSRRELSPSPRYPVDVSAGAGHAAGLRSEVKPGHEARIHRRRAAERPQDCPGRGRASSAFRGAARARAHGAHYDVEMSQLFLDELGVPEPDHRLAVGSRTRAEQTARVMGAFERVVRYERLNLALAPATSIDVPASRSKTRWSVR